MAVATASLVLVGATDLDLALTALDELTEPGRLVALHADGRLLDDRVGESEELRHRAKGLTPEVEVEPREDDVLALLGELLHDRDDAVVKELDLVDADDIRVLRKTQNVLRARSRQAVEGDATVRGEFSVGARVATRLEHDHVLTGDAGGLSVSDERRALAGEHAARVALDGAAASTVTEKVHRQNS